jgi:predicted  nucleic acid-binding Zn-ribbon protein
MSQKAPVSTNDDGCPRCGERSLEIVPLDTRERRRMNDESGIDAPKNRDLKPGAPPHVGNASIVDREARAEPRARCRRGHGHEGEAIQAAVHDRIGDRANAAPSLAGLRVSAAIVPAAPRA